MPVYCDRCLDKVQRMPVIPEYSAGTRCESCARVYTLTRPPYFKTRRWSWVEPEADDMLIHITEVRT
jgi:hypothetical protein